jgi:hypothetical protein
MLVAAQAVQDKPVAPDIPDHENVGVGNALTTMLSIAQ